MSAPFLRLLILFGGLQLQVGTGGAESAASATGGSVRHTLSTLVESVGQGAAAPADSGSVCDTLWTVRQGESLFTIANHLLSWSHYYTDFELVEEIRRYNDLPSDTLRPGQELRIPLTYEELANATIAKPRDFEARGIYANAWVAGTSKVLALADSLVRAGGNTIVFDIKDRPGDLSYDSQVPLAVSIGASARSTIARPGRLVGLLHQRGIHVVARITCFYDARLARARPDLAPRSRDEEGPWREKGKLGWLDPSLPGVQDYLLAIIEEVAAMGVDEIQLDYIRFPTEGKVEAALFAFDPEAVPKHEVITGFLKRVRQVLEPTRILLSADIFGVVAWGRREDVERTGQYLQDMLPLLDAVSPMLYPSHFYGTFDQITNPVAYPYYLVYQGCRQMKGIAAPHGVAVRPWIQAFSYRVSNFEQGYITEQLHGAAEGGARGWLLWNAAGRYKRGLAAIHGFVSGTAVVDSATRANRIPVIEPPDEADPQPLGAGLEDGLPGGRYQEKTSAE